MTYKVIMIKIDRRISDAAKVQNVLTEYGCNIKVRLGLHEISEEHCANDGLILLQVDGEKSHLDTIVEKLNEVEFVTAQLVEM